MVGPSFQGKIGATHCEYYGYPYAVPAACVVCAGKGLHVRLQCEKDDIVGDGVVGCEADDGRRLAAASCWVHDATRASEVEVDSHVRRPPDVSAQRRPS